MENDETESLLLDSFGVSDGIKFIQKLFIKLSDKIGDEIDKSCDDDDNETAYDWVILNEKLKMVQVLIDKL